MIKIGKDKYLHFVVNFISTVLVFTAYYFCIPSVVYHGLVTGALFSLGLSIGKEYGDSKSLGNTWSWADMVANILGIISACLLVLLVL